jgi:hypothetical protein
MSPSPSLHRALSSPRAHSGKSYTAVADATLDSTLRRRFRHGLTRPTSPLPLAPNLGSLLPFPRHLGSLVGA